jgi:hypothetical protein
VPLHVRDYDPPVTQSYRGAEFGDVDMSGATFRETDLSNVRMRGVLLFNADIDGAINGLKVNGVEVLPLIEAELDRRHPERLTLRPTTPKEVVAACDVVEAMWRPTIERAVALEAQHRSVDGEWSVAETLRHLVFVVDAWFGHAVLGEARPYHALGLGASFMSDTAALGVDALATPTFDEVVEAHRGRVAGLRAFGASATQDDLDRLRDPNPTPGYPPAKARTATECLHVIFNEEWAHHQFAARDLAIIEAA